MVALGLYSVDRGCSCKLQPKLVDPKWPEALQRKSAIKGSTLTIIGDTQQLVDNAVFRRSALRLDLDKFQLQRINSLEKIPLVL